MPITEKQLAANRENCLRSTGPRTPEGKAAASMNAVRHGCFARTLLLPSEDPAQFETFAAGLLDDLRPEGALESDIATRLVATAWRLRRVPVAEAAIFSPDVSDEASAKSDAPTSPGNPSAASPDSSSPSTRSTLSTKSTQSTPSTQPILRDPPSNAPFNPGAHYLRRLRRGADPLAGISRHEARLHRQFERDLQLFDAARERRLKREREEREIALRRAQDPDDPLYDPSKDPLYELRQRRLARSRRKVFSNAQSPAAPGWHGLPARDALPASTPGPDTSQSPDKNGFVSADPAHGVRSSIQKAPDPLSPRGTPHPSDENGFVSADNPHVAAASSPDSSALSDSSDKNGFVSADPAQGVRSSIQKAPDPLPAAVPQSPAENGFVSADNPHVAAVPSPDSSDKNGFVFRNNAPPLETLDTLYHDQLRIERQLGLPPSNEEVEALA